MAQINNLRVIQCFEITPSDEADLAVVVDAIYVGVGGLTQG